jgi:hypothetical protein
LRSCHGGLVSFQLAQFCKRLRLDHFLALTEPLQDVDAREKRAYQMRDGIEAVRAALREVGVAPR